HGINDRLAKGEHGQDIRDGQDKTLLLASFHGAPLPELARARRALIDGSLSKPPLAKDVSNDRSAASAPRSCQRSVEVFQGGMAPRHHDSAEHRGALRRRRAPWRRIDELVR